jgi:hypothetical protein
MVHYSLLLISLLSAATLSAAVPAPQPETTGLFTIPANGLPNGMYEVDLNEDGTTRFTLIDAANTSTDDEALQSPDLVARGEGAACGGFNVNSYDLQQAQAMWRDFCGNGRKWYNRSKVISYNSVLAFGCSYGGDQGCNRDYIQDFYNKIAAYCGPVAGGFYSYPKNKVSYGYINNGGNFC